MTNLTETLAVFAPQIAASYVAIITRAFDRVTEQFGPSHFGVYNSDSAKFYSETVGQFAKREGNRPSDPVSLNTDRLQIKANEYAARVTAEWEAKIASKVGEIEQGEVRHMDGFTFQIVGTRNGRKVLIEQNMIINQSPKGTVFNQFPARIYLDGKFTSAAAYAKAF